MTTRDAVTLTAAARELGVSEQTVRNWADRGVLPAWRHPTRNARMFDRADVDAMRKRIGNEQARRAG